jgi:hypothetical protein
MYLVDFGGIILSPPDEDEKVKKDHLCKQCYDDLVKWIEVDEQEPS